MLKNHLEKYLNTYTNDSINTFKSSFQEHIERESWAVASCKVIMEGHVFKQCREKVTNYEDFYNDCLYDSCGLVSLLLPTYL